MINYIIGEVKLRIRIIKLISARKIILKEVGNCIHNNYKKNDCQNLMKADDILEKHIRNM